MLRVLPGSAAVESMVVLLRSVIFFSDTYILKSKLHVWSRVNNHILYYGIAAISVVTTSRLTG